MRKDLERIRAYISGRVQGVFFRANAIDKAKELNLKGWVRNLSDGRVEVLVEGPKDKVRALLEWCRKGPPLARVNNVEEVIEEPTGEFIDFSVNY